MNCPICLYPLSETRWQPPSGIDPALRQYKCTKCRVLRYINHRQFKLEQEQQLELIKLSPKDFLPYFHTYHDAK